MQDIQLVAPPLFEPAEDLAVIARDDSGYRVYRIAESGEDQATAGGLTLSLARGDLVRAHEDAHVRAIRPDLDRLVVTYAAHIAERSEAGGEAFSEASVGDILASQGSERAIVLSFILNQVFPLFGKSQGARETPIDLPHLDIDFNAFTSNSLGVSGFNLMERCLMERPDGTLRDGVMLLQDMAYELQGRQTGTGLGAIVNGITYYARPTYRRLDDIGVMFRGLLKKSVFETVKRSPDLTARLMEHRRQLELYKRSRISTMNQFESNGRGFRIEPSHPNAVWFYVLLDPHCLEGEEGNIYAFPQEITRDIREGQTVSQRLIDAVKKRLGRGEYDIPIGVEVFYYENRIQIGKPCPMKAFPHPFTPSDTPMDSSHPLCLGTQNLYYASYKDDRGRESPLERLRAYFRRVREIIPGGYNPVESMPHRYLGSSQGMMKLHSNVKTAETIAQQLGLPIMRYAEAKIR
ncbi:MAG: hypothetical protein ABH879_01360 [archaeon]